MELVFAAGLLLAVERPVFIHVGRLGLVEAKDAEVSRTDLSGAPRGGGWQG